MAPSFDTAFILYENIFIDGNGEYYTFYSALDKNEVIDIVDGDAILNIWFSQEVSEGYKNYTIVEERPSLTRIDKNTFTFEGLETYTRLVPINDFFITVRPAPLTNLTARDSLGTTATISDFTFVDGEDPYYKIKVGTGEKLFDGYIMFSANGYKTQKVYCEKDVFIDVNLLPTSTPSPQVNLSRNSSRDIIADEASYVLKGAMTVGGVGYTADQIEELYRTILFIRAMNYITNCSLKGINELLGFYFRNRGRFYCYEYAPMHLRYVFEFYLSKLERLVFESGLLPKPAGVKISFEYLPNQAFFGFNTEEDEQSYTPFNNAPFYK